MVTAAAPKVPVAISWHERKLRFRMLDVRRLRVLRELAARGTIAATADALGYTAPAVSQQLAALEREAGVALLESNGRRRRLTPAGEELVQRTEGILRELEAAEAALERTTTHVAGVLRCAAFASAHRDPAPARDRRPRAAPSRPARDHARHGARGQPARAQARRARPRARAGVRVRPHAGRPGDRAHRPARGPPARRAAGRPPARRPSPRSTCARSSTSRGSPAARARSATSSSSTRRARPATSRGSTHITNDFDVSYALVANRRRRRARARAGRPAAARRRRAARHGRAAEPADLRRGARGQQRAPGDRGDARSAHRALSTESSRPGKRSSSSSRRSRFTSAVPSARCSITPRLAQDAEVMRARGLGHRQLEGAAAALAARRRGRARSRAGPGRRARAGRRSARACRREDDAECAARV